MRKLLVLVQFALLLNSCSQLNSSNACQDNRAIDALREEIVSKASEGPYLDNLYDTEKFDSIIRLHKEEIIIKRFSSPIYGGDSTCACIATIGFAKDSLFKEAMKTNVEEIKSIDDVYSLRYTHNAYKLEYYDKGVWMVTSSILLNRDSTVSARWFGFETTSIFKDYVYFRLYGKDRKPI